MVLICGLKDPCSPGAQGSLCFFLNNLFVVGFLPKAEISPNTHGLEISQLGN